MNITPDRLTKASKFLSLVLRHQPGMINLVLDRQGWASITELIEKSPPEMLFDYELVEQVVVSNDKKRFSISDDGRKIRANQGHSIQVDLDLGAEKPPPILYHGTATRFLSSILQEGLRPGQRHHVHLSTDRNTAMSVGRRYGCPVILEVASGKMYEQGFVFFLSSNHIWLTELVPPAFLKQVDVECSEC